MGKSSSTKKVARAARAGGRSSMGQQRNLLFPSVLALIIVLGTSLIVFARQDRLANADDSPPQLGDHIHMSYATYVCDAYLPDLGEFHNDEGIHTHGDGVIHAHPQSQLATGRNARLSLFLRDSGVKLTDDSLEASGETHKNGEKCGDKEAEVYVLRWDDITDEEPTRLTGDLLDIRIDDNGGALAVVFAPPDADVPPPTSFANLAELGAADGGDVAPDPSTSSTEGTGSSTSSTTADETTSSTAAESTTSSSTP